MQSRAIYIVLPLVYETVYQGICNYVVVRCQAMPNLLF